MDPQATPTRTLRYLLDGVEQITFAQLAEKYQLPVTSLHRILLRSGIPRFKDANQYYYPLQQVTEHMSTITPRRRGPSQR